MSGPLPFAAAVDTTDVVIDIDRYFAPASGSTLAFYPLTLVVWLTSEKGRKLQ